MTPSDARLNKLIEDYRAENERCTNKINELKNRLQSQQDDRQNGLTHDRIYAKSFKVTSQNVPRNQQRGMSASRSSKSGAGRQNYYKQNLMNQGLMRD